MKKSDASCLGEESLQLLRSQAHRLRLDGRTWVEFASIVGVSLGAMMDWARRCRLGGDGFSEENAVSLRRGRVQGANLALYSGDEALLRQWIIQDRPVTHGLPYALWTRRAVQELIRAKFDIDMPIRTDGDYLMRWGMTLQRPARCAREQDQTTLEAWTIETAIRQDKVIRGYAPSGQTPHLLHSARCDSIAMMSAMTNQGLVRFRLHDGAINTKSLFDSLQGLLDDTQNKVFLIVDNLRVHYAKQVRQWVDERKDRIELHYLLPYSPEANPAKWLNRDLRTELRLRPVALDKTGLKRMVENFICQIFPTPERMAHYFKLV